MEAQEYKALYNNAARLLNSANYKLSQIKDICERTTMDNEQTKADPTPELTREEICFNAIHAALDELKRAKPNDRSEQDRIYAVTITDMEKALAYFGYNCVL
jgi:hypothetical protein